MSIKWVKPSGQEIETNELPATVEKAESLKWRRLDELNAPLGEKPAKKAVKSKKDVK